MNMAADGIGALLDAHDTLVKACVDESLSFTEFLAAYGDFPQNYALLGQGKDPPDRDVLRLFRRRIGFHARVADVVSGLGSIDDVNTPFGGTGNLASKIGLMRLRALVARFPQFEAERETSNHGC
jgi:hypothetical protein